MKKVIKNIQLGFWMYWFLIRLHTICGNMRRYRESGEIEKEQAEILRATTKWGTDVTKKAGVKINVQGLENIPKSGPVVFVSNHQGYGDIPVFSAAVTTKQFGFVAKSDLGRLPRYGRWIADIRSVFIERDDPRESLKAIDRGIELLNQGFSLVIFGEGTRSKGGEMGSFKKGSLRMATKPGVPIVPVTLDGTWKIFEEHGYVCPAEVDFYIHPAIETKGLSKPEANNLTQTVEDIIRSKLEEFQKRK